MRFAIAAFNSRQAALAREMAAPTSLPLEIHVGRTPELIRSATVCLACSGSVSLELLYHLKPTVILYQVSRLAFFIQRYFRTVRFITLVNLLASDHPFGGKGELYDPATDRVPFPEYLTCEDRSQVLADHVVRWLVDPAVRQQTIEQLRRLHADFAVPGASERAADYVLGQLQQRSRPASRPHYTAQRAA